MEEKNLQKINTPKKEKKTSDIISKILHKSSILSLSGMVVTMVNYVLKTRKYQKIVENSLDKQLIQKTLEDQNNAWEYVEGAMVITAVIMMSYLVRVIILNAQFYNKNKNKTKNPAKK